jgi:hypothetical protein
MLYYTPPPVVPVDNYMYLAHYVKDCQKGDRDCFPEDTVGGFIDDHRTPLPASELRFYSPLLKTLAPIER